MPRLPRVSVPAQAALAGGGWAIAVLAALLAIYGGPGHVAFVNPDEATTRHAVRQVIERGRPVEAEPFDDPNDLTHQRLWVTPDGTLFTPAYPATLPLLYGWVDRLLPYGGWLAFVLPAAGAGGLVAAVALLLPRLNGAAVLVPGAGFPGTYFLVRPWLNIGALVAAVGVAALCFALWARSRRTVWGVLALGVATLAAAIRPDQIHIVLGVSALAFLAVARGRERWWWLGGHVVAGTAAAAIVAVGNRLTTGAWLTTPVDLLELPGGVEPWASSLPTPLNHVFRILGQNGLPAPELFLEQSAKYWVDLGPAWLLTLLAVPLTIAAVVLLARSGQRRLALIVGTAAVLIASLYVTRLSPTDYGAGLDYPLLTHSLPRYAALTFVGAGVAVVAGAVLLPRPWLRGAGIGLATGLAVAGTAYVFDAPDGVPEEDIAFLDEHYEEVDTLPWRFAAETDDDAIVYSAGLDKYLWAGVEVGLIQHEGAHKVRGRAEDEPVALDQLPGTLDRALEAGWQPYVFEVPGDALPAFETALADRGLRLEPVTIATRRGWEVRRG